MELTILGTSSGYPDLARNFSGYLFQTNSTKILLEAGDGLVRELLKYKVNPVELDAIIISHTHPDHASGLYSILQWIHLEKRQDPLVLYIPKGIKEKFIDSLYLFHLYPEHLHFPLIVKDISEDQDISIGDFKWVPIKNHHLNNKQNLALTHTIQALGFSFLIKSDNSLKIFYTSDIDSLKYLDNFHEKFDIFLSEITHISLEELNLFVRKRNIKQTILTHIPKEKEAEIKMAVQRNSLYQLAQDGEVLNI